MKNKYVGQTGRSMYERMKEHFSNWEMKKEDSPLWQHSMEHHQSEPFPVEIKVMRRCFGKPTRRMITESVLIEQTEEKESMNSKSEYGYVRIPRVNIEEI